MEATFDTLLAFVLASFLTGFFKTSFGGGIGMVIAPILTLLVSARMAMGIIAPLMVLGDLLVVYFFWKKWDGSFVLALLPSMVVGTIVGTALLAYLSDAGIRRLIGGFAFFYSLYHIIKQIRQSEITYVPPTRTAGHLVGMLAGFSTTAAHSGGVITTPYFVSSGLKKGAVVATGFGLFGITNVFKLGTYLYADITDPQIILWAAYTVPLLAVGAYLGFKAHKAVSNRMFNSIILIIALTGSLKLLLI